MLLRGLHPTKTQRPFVELRVKASDVFLKMRPREAFLVGSETDKPEVDVLFLLSKCTKRPFMRAVRLRAEVTVSDVFLCGLLSN